MIKAKQAVVAAGLAAGLLGGGAAGMILGGTGVSGAQNAATTTTSVVAQPGNGNSQNEAAEPDPATRLKSTLDPLVAAGTINQTQEDAVIKALTDAGAVGRGGPGHGGREGGPQLDAAAQALGMTTAELRTAVQGGQTIAQVAASKQVSVQTVIDAMVAALKAQEASEVASGAKTQAQVDQQLATATARITDMVNNGGWGGGHRN